MRFPRIRPHGGLFEGGLFEKNDLSGGGLFEGNYSEVGAYSRGIIRRWGLIRGELFGKSKIGQTLFTTMLVCAAELLIIQLYLILTICADFNIQTLYSKNTQIKQSRDEPYVS